MWKGEAFNACWAWQYKPKSEYPQYAERGGGGQSSQNGGGIAEYSDM